MEVVGLVELQPIVDAKPVEARHITVVGAVESEVAHVLDHDGAPGGQILSVHRRDRHDALDVVPKVEIQGRVVGVVLEIVEGSGVRDGLTSSRVAHEHDVAHVDLALERISVFVVEPIEELDVLEQEPPARVVFAADAPVDEVLVDTRQDVSTTRE